MLAVSAGHGSTSVELSRGRREKGDVENRPRRSREGAVGRRNGVVIGEIIRINQGNIHQKTREAEVDINRVDMEDRGVDRNRMRWLGGRGTDGEGG